MNWAGEVLEKNPMFGKVQRHGKVGRSDGIVRGLNTDE